MARLRLQPASRSPRISLLPHEVPSPLQSSSPAVYDAVTGLRSRLPHAPYRAASRAGVAFHLIGADTPAVNRPLRIAGVLRHLDPHRRRSVADVLADLGPDTRPVVSHGEQDR